MFVSGQKKIVPDYDRKKRELSLVTLAPVKEKNSRLIGIDGIVRLEMCNIITIQVRIETSLKKR